MVGVLGDLAAPMDDKAVMFPLYIVGLYVLGSTIHLSAWRWSVDLSIGNAKQGCPSSCGMTTRNNSNSLWLGLLNMS